MDFYDGIFNKAFGLFSAGFGVTVIICSIASLLTFGIFALIIVKFIKSWKKDNHSPRLTVPAKIISKRTAFSHHSYRNSTNSSDFYGYGTSTDTWYYVTFQVDSGDRIEFCVAGYEYGLLIEGDVGKLTFQGSRYLAFERS